MAEKECQLNGPASTAAWTNLVNLDHERLNDIGADKLKVGMPTAREGQQVLELQALRRLSERTLRGERERPSAPCRTALLGRGLTPVRNGQLGAREEVVKNHYIVTHAHETIPETSSTASASAVPNARLCPLTPNGCRRSPLLP